MGLVLGLEVGDVTLAIKNVGQCTEALKKGTLFSVQEVVEDTAHGEDVHHAGGAPVPQQHLWGYPALCPRHP